MIVNDVLAYLVDEKLSLVLKLLVLVDIVFEAVFKEFVTEDLVP
jgi:hypothetical protein